ncbi:MAG TPA: phosphoribosylamine--glycine ligase [Gemmatimonadaceae bacterium]|jgi:phosphoribosylamine--glycine ligase|nr:phosphoribosylamine--glycine ligase [Gemmatimonadaceae bacterium]
MKVLLVGSGGREHALAWKLLQDDPTIELICAPGNAGIAEITDCIPVKATDIKGLAAFAERARVDLTVVGPEIPIEAGIVDLFQGAGRKIFGPTQNAARIETSKSFAKEIMRDAGVQTARATTHSDIDLAKAALREAGAPIVVKACGLAAGKGVVVAHSIEEAERAIEMMIGDRAFGDAGAEVLLEDYMEGEELSLFAITDGTNVVPLIGAQDHKRLLDDDLGPNTGGMGAYCPVSIATQSLVDEIVGTVFLPTLAGLRSRDSMFTGLLYAGLMITSDGPKVVEFNCRFGDPETQAILPLMKSSLLELVTAVANGDSLRNVEPVEWKDDYAVTTVLASAGYPDSPHIGDSIRLPAVPNGIQVFHAGTKRGPATGELMTAGGRVLSITGVARSLAEAAASSREYADRVSFDGKQMRRDIAWRELERNARVT